MAVGSIYTAKELSVTYQPLMLVECVMTNGTRLRWSTHDLRNATLGYRYAGVDWEPRIVNQELAAIQALSGEGIDVVPSVTLKLADPDKSLWTKEQDYGFKGAQIRVFFVMWNVDQNDFSTDQLTKFLGVVQSPSMEPGYLNITALNKLNLSNSHVPSIRIQQTCPWSFPNSATKRQDGADNPDSPYYECGYSPDCSGSNARGNYATGVTPFSVCDYTQASCVSRGMYDEDSSARVTGRFGGVTWITPESIRSRGYTSGGKWEDIAQSKNETRYQDLVPLVYGVQWVEPLILNTVGDGNLTKMECLLCYGEANAVWDVIVNGTRIPHADDDSRFPNMSGYKEGGNNIKGFWRTVNRGTRDGSPNDDALYTDESGNPLGDPYGSLCVIEVVVPRELAQAGSSARVLVRMKGPSIKVFAAGTSTNVSGVTNATPMVVTTASPHGLSDGMVARISGVVGTTAANGQWVARNVTATTFELWDYSGAERLVSGAGNAAYSSGGVVTPLVGTDQYSENPAWIMLDLLMWCGWRFTDVDLMSFITAASHCDASISYRNRLGAITTHPRFSAAFTVRSRRSAGEVIRGLRNTCRGTLVPNYEQYGKLSLTIRGTLAMQQPTAVSGSNYTSPIASYAADGSSVNGYSAYDFDESDILRDGSGRPTLQIVPRQESGVPNRLQIQFQDTEADHSPESGLTLLDTEDVDRSGSEVPGDFSLVGIQNFDQARRCLSYYLAEGYRGNPRTSTDWGPIGDTGGTMVFRFTTSVRAVHLKIGDICRITAEPYGLSNQMFRIMSIQPALNFETVQIQGTFHYDQWYLDTYGQIDAPKWRPKVRDLFGRPAYAWSPYGTAPLSGDSLLNTTEYTFALASDYETLADNTALAKAVIGGREPVNLFPASPEAPFIPLQGTTASTGGTIRGGQTLYVVVCGKTVTGSSYELTAPQVRLCAIAIPTGTNTNTVTVPNIVWDGVAAGYVVFAGNDVNRLSYQASGDTTPSSITLTAYNEANWTVPDPEFDHFMVRVKRILHGGCWGAQVLSCTSNTIQISVLSGTNAGFTTNQWADYHVSLLGLYATEGNLPLANWKVLSNTSDTLTLYGGQIDPTAITRPDGTTGLQAGDVLVMRFKPTYGSNSTGNYLEDANIVNSLGLLGNPISVSAATNATPIAITTSSAHGLSTGAKVYVQGATGNTAANGLWTVTVTGSTTYTLDSSVGSGTYSGGATAAPMSQGFITDREKGRFLRCLYGTGRGSLVKIKSNTATRVYIEGNWPVTPDSTSIWIIEEPAWQVEVPTESANQNNYQNTVSIPVDLSNYLNQTLLVKVFTVDGGGNECSDYSAPAREVYQFGNAGTLGFTGAIYLNVPTDTTGLAIGTDLCPPVFLAHAATATAVRAEVGTAPTGAGLSFDIYVGSTFFMSLTIPAGSTYVNATAGQIAAAPEIPAETRVKLNITAVGSTFPGADLTCIIFV